jgi:hypothetical protein
LKEQHRLRVLENEMLRKVFEFKCDHVTGEWMECYSERLHGVYSVFNIVFFE